jgi:hypothetical protein
MIKRRKLLALSFLISPGISAGQNGIILNKLSDCQGLHRIQTSLDSPISRDCRLARNQVEHVLMVQFARTLGVSACLLSSPVDFLTGFACVELALQGKSREILCFKGIRKSTLDNYMKTYDAVYRELAIKYVDDAGRCSVGTGDASATPDSVFPPPLKIVAKARFGFALVLGDRKGQVYHGYADLDPSIDDGAGGALEVFDFFKLFKIDSSPTSIISASNEFTLEVNDVLDARRNAANTLQQQYNKPAVAKMRFIDLKYTGTKDIPFSQRKNDLDSWQRGVGSELKNAGFRELTPDELAKTPFGDPDSLRDMIANNLPFGVRELKHQTIGPHFVFLVDDRYDPCTAVAEVMVLEPEPEVKIDYGTVGIMLTGLGNCYNAQRPGGTLSDQLLVKVTQHLKEAVNNR